MFLAVAGAQIELAIFPLGGSGSDRAGHIPARWERVCWTWSHSRIVGMRKEWGDRFPTVRESGCVGLCAGVVLSVARQGESCTMRRQRIRALARRESGRPAWSTVLGRSSSADGAGSTGFLSHPSAARVRTGNTTSKSAAWRAIRRRVVLPSAITRNRATREHVQPRSAASLQARRTFRSSETSMAWLSGTTVFTSMTTIEPVRGCQASTSTEPRSPAIANVASTAVSQPSPWSSSITAATRLEWSSSSSRSRPSACHRSRSSTSASTASPTARRVANVMRPTRPSSMRLTVESEIRARLATSDCRSP